MTLVEYVASLLRLASSSALSLSRFNPIAPTLMMKAFWTLDIIGVDQGDVVSGGLTTWVG